MEKQLIKILQLKTPEQNNEFRGFVGVSRYLAREALGREDRDSELAKLPKEDNE